MHRSLLFLLSAVGLAGGSPAYEAEERTRFLHVPGGALPAEVPGRLAVRSVGAASPRHSPGTRARRAWKVRRQHGHGGRRR